MGLGNRGRELLVVPEGVALEGDRFAIFDAEVSAEETENLAFVKGLRYVMLSLLLLWFGL
jgi:hypothetical protein